uniref:BTB domain-containing protein n=1 Tax=Steinernema glaseri TaxID=37863 RepID=A0A1I7XZ02_9BILA
MILSSKDAAKFQVADGKNRPNLWLSKAILSRNSPVFAAMFESDFLEKSTNHHVINDTTLEEFLRFIALMYPVKYEFVGRSIGQVVDFYGSLLAEG